MFDVPVDIINKTFMQDTRWLYNKVIEWKPNIVFTSDLIFVGETNVGYELILVNGNEYLADGAIVRIFPSDFAKLVPLMLFGKASNVKLTYAKKNVNFGVKLK